MRVPGVEVLHEPLDGAALARGIPALEENDQPPPVGLDPLLQLEQLDLQQPLLSLVLLVGDALLIGVTLPPGVDDGAVDGAENVRWRSPPTTSSGSGTSSATSGTCPLGER